MSHRICGECAFLFKWDFILIFDLILFSRILLYYWFSFIFNGLLFVKLLILKWVLKLRELSFRHNFSNSIKRSCAPFSHKQLLHGQLITDRFIIIKKNTRFLWSRNLILQIFRCTTILNNFQRVSMLTMFHIIHIFILYIWWIRRYSLKNHFHVPLAAISKITNCFIQNCDLLMVITDVFLNFSLYLLN